MHRVMLTGWRVGLKKVSLNELLWTRAKLDARTAHQLVDRLLDGQSVTLEFPDEAQARQFAAEAEELGAIVQVLIGSEW